MRAFPGALRRQHALLSEGTRCLGPVALSDAKRPLLQKHPFWYASLRATGPKQRVFGEQRVWPTQRSREGTPFLRVFVLGIFPFFALFVLFLLFFSPLNFDLLPFLHLSFSFSFFLFLFPRFHILFFSHPLGPPALSTDSVFEGFRFWHCSIFCHFRPFPSFFFLSILTCFLFFLYPFPFLFSFSFSLVSLSFSFRTP